MWEQLGQPLRLQLRCSERRPLKEQRHTEGEVLGVMVLTLGKIQTGPEWNEPGFIVPKLS